MIYVPLYKQSPVDSSNRSLLAFLFLNFDSLLQILSIKSDIIGRDQQTDSRSQSKRLLELPSAAIALYMCYIVTMVQ